MSRININANALSTNSKKIIMPFIDDKKFNSNPRHYILIKTKRDWKLDGVDCHDLGAFHTK